MGIGEKVTAEFNQRPRVPQLETASRTFPVRRAIRHSSMAPLSLAAAGVVLLPALHSWWTGRTLLARQADPAFPELLLHRAQHRAAVVVAAAVVAIALATEHWAWTIPLLLIAHLAGGFSFRKALYGETWSLGAYLRFTIMSVIGAAGFWLLLAFAPRLVVGIVQGWEPAQPVVTAAAIGGLVAAILIVWERRFPKVWLALHRGSPLDRPDLQPRLDEIVRRAGLKTAPAVYRFGARGSYMMNAIALPSIRNPGVGFGDTLLDLLDTDEIVAVFAHEIAHLEHFNARRLSRLRLLTHALIAGGVGAAVAAIHLLPGYGGLIAMAWPVIVLAVLAQRVSQSQKHEAESDRRSAELVGDPEPMVRALTKLHHYSKLPRRWPYDFERSASHPSLARRIQALRGMTQSTALASPSVEPTILRSTTPGSYIVLDATRIYWFDGVAPLPPAPNTAPGTAPIAATTRDDATPALPPAPSLASLRDRAASYRATAYAELVELRVGVAGFGRAMHVRDRAGKSSAAPLHPDDVAAAQRALDMLDGQIATRGGHDWRLTTRLVATLLALLLVASLDFGWAWIPVIVALIAPRAWSLAAAGTLAAGRAAVTALTNSGHPGPLSWVIAAMAVIVGGIACIAAWRWATGAETARRKQVVQTAAAMAAALLLVAVQGYGLRGAHLDWSTAPAEVVARFPTEGFGRGVQLSPEGGRVAIQSVGASWGNPYDDEGAASWRFDISAITGGTAAPRRSIDAVAVRFLDEDRVLALRQLGDSDSLELIIMGLGADSAPTWRRPLPSIVAPLLRVDRATSRWTIVGHDTDASETVVVRGGLDSAPPSVERSSYELLGGRPLHAWSDGSILSAMVEVRGGAGRMVLASVGALPFEWTISRTQDGRREPIGAVPGAPECTADGSVVHCVATGLKGATLWRIDGDGTLTPLGALPRDFDLWRVGGAHHVVAAERGSGNIALIDAAAARGTILSVPPSAAGEHGFMMDAATAPGLLAALTTEDGRSEVTLYRVR